MTARLSGLLRSPTRDLAPAQRARLRRIWAARFLSELGTKAAFAALVLRVAHVTSSATTLSLVLTATVLADALTTPLAGIVGDLYDRKRIMIVSDLAAAGLWTVLGFMQGVWAIAVVAVLATAAESFYFPASNASLPNLFDRAQLGAVNARFAQARTAGAICGPLVAGLVTVRFGAAPVFWINAASFAVAAILMAGVRGSFGGRVPGHQASSHGRRGGHVRDMLGVLRDHPVVLTFMAMWAAIQLGTGALWVATPELAGQLGRLSPTYALLLTTGTAGSFVGAWAAARLFSVSGPARLILVSLAAEAALLLGTAFVPTVLVAVATLAGFRAAEMVSGASSYTLLQSATDDRVRARSAAWTDAATVGAFGIGVAVAGPIVDGMGARPAFVTAAACLLLGLVLARRMVRQVGVLSSPRY